LDDSGLYMAAKKLSALIERSTMHTEEQQVGVTISIGMTIVRMEDTVKSIIDRADRNMYKSKQAGHNRVTGDGENKGNHVG
jgi:two-component system, cell cycle response regulator